MDAVKTVDYKGYTIAVHQDTDATSPDDWGNEDLFLITTRNRYFEVQRKGFDLDDAASGVYKKDYHVIPLIAYCHSGVSLSLSSDRYPFNDQWDAGQIGFVLVKKRQGFRDINKAAESLVEEWNDYLSGNVYGYIVADADGEDTDMSCSGFYGDPDKYMIPEVKAEIDAVIKRDTERVITSAGDVPLEARA